MYKIDKQQGPTVSKGNSTQYSVITYKGKVSEKGFPDSSVGKESACIVGDLGSIPGMGRSLGEGKGYPL